ncbi:hypothetical protein Xhom_01923 [Xenorhabdus hominickii]|uniref:Uncharacterized protein n=1 Tax=Xenorhabdus hominickii TaxID=351679 RepID=A0A2G0QB25_XENHO|nr:hypothetical protein Xhom_01923 [Xenorhabdus hominickii]
MKILIFYMVFLSQATADKGVLLLDISDDILDAESIYKMYIFPKGSSKYVKCVFIGQALIGK